MKLTQRFLLNLIVVLGLLTGGLLSFLPQFSVPPELQGALWGGLLLWLASAKANGVPE